MTIIDLVEFSVSNLVFVLKAKEDKISVNILLISKRSS